MNLKSQIKSNHRKKVQIKSNIQIVKWFDPPLVYSVVKCFHFRISILYETFSLKLAGGPPSAADVKFAPLKKARETGGAMVLLYGGFMNYTAYLGM